MARKKGKRPKQRLIEVCQNDGGLGIPACEGSQVATVQVTLDMAFTGLDNSKLQLCADCADRLRDHAEEMGYEVDLD